MNRPTLVISLDFELHWGRFDKVPIQNWETYYQTAREVIPKLLSLFSQYEVEVTWANPSPILLAEIQILCNGGVFVKTPGISAVPSM